MTDIYGAAKLALEALETSGDKCPLLERKAITALREALAEQPAPMIRGDIRDGLVDGEPAQQQEPVAWRSWNDHDGYGFWETKQEAEPWCAPDFFAEPLYTSPQPAQQEPVAKIEIARCKFTGELESWKFAERPRNAPAGTYYVYTSPQPAQRKPLPYNKEDMKDLDSPQRLAFKLGWRSAEEAHNIKENT